MTYPAQEGAAPEPGVPAGELRGPDGEHALQRRREVRQGAHVPTLALDRATSSKNRMMSNERWSTEIVVSHKYWAV